MKFKNAAVALALTLASASYAQYPQQPYAGLEKREIKALSDKEIEQYLSGAGAGYAMSAELNRFPGPSHVLELAEQLGLSAAQRAGVMKLLDAHKAEASAIGAKLVQAERDLEALFRRGNVAEAELSEAVRKAAALKGEYRLSHLETHRRTRPLLSEHQVMRYDELRGYSTSTGASKHRH